MTDAAPAPAGLPAMAIVPPAVPVVAPPPAPDSFPIGLVEFCTRHSKSEGPELLGAFFAEETAVGRGEALRTHDAHLAALKAFASRPVA